jgi:hypothetical protein
MPRRRPGGPARVRQDHGRRRRGGGVGTYSSRRKGRQAEVYDRPAIERAQLGTQNRAGNSRGGRIPATRSG